MLVTGSIRPESVLSVRADYMGFSVRLPVLKASMENSAQVAVNARMSFAMRQLDAFADKMRVSQMSVVFPQPFLSHLESSVYSV